MKSKLAKLIVIVVAAHFLVGCKTARTPPKNVVLQLSPQQKLKRKIETAKINAQLGMAYLERKNIKRAKLKLLLALKQGPTIPEPWYSMGYFLEATGNKNQAKEYYLKAIKVAPHRGDAQNNYGTFLCRSGQYKESIKHFVRAARSHNYLDPAAAYENAGLCAMSIPAYKTASHYFSQALSEDPARKLSLVKLAKAEYKLGNYKIAKQKLRQFTLVSPPTNESKKLSKLLSRKLG